MIIMVSGLVLTQHIQSALQTVSEAATQHRS